jgi:hypothetical protein
MNMYQSRGGVNRNRKTLPDREENKQLLEAKGADRIVENGTETVNH